MAVQLLYVVGKLGTIERAATMWRSRVDMCCVCVHVFVCVELRRGVLGFIPDAVPVSYTARASSLRYRHDIW